MSEFSNRFRQLKEEYGLTLKDLSSELNITIPNLSYYMKGREPSYDVLINIADYFNVTTDWLIGRTDARNESQETIYQQIESELNISEDLKLTAQGKSYYFECQNLLYKTLKSLYTLFVFYQSDENFSEYLSKQIKMYSGILYNLISYFNKLYVYASKDNILKFIKYGETCSDVQKQLLLATIYNYAHYTSAADEDIPASDKESLNDILNFVFENFEEKFPETQTIEMFNQLNEFKLDEQILSSIKDKQ